MPMTTDTERVYRGRGGRFVKKGDPSAIPTSLIRTLILGKLRSSHHETIRGPPIPPGENYVDVQFTYRASKNDASRDVKRATYRIWGETRSSFNSAQYLAEKHDYYKRTDGAAWNVNIVGSGRKTR